MMELSEFKSSGPFNNSTFTKNQVKKKQRDLRILPVNNKPKNNKKDSNIYHLPFGIGLILLSVLFIFIYYLKQRTLWAIYKSYENPPKLLETFIIGLMVMCWPFYYLKFYIL